MTTLLEDLLAKPVSSIQTKKDSVPEYTSKVELSGAEANVELNGEPSSTDESAARQVLRNRGENPDHWVATKFESSERELASGQTLISSKYAFARIGTRAAQLAQQTVQQEIPWDSIEEELANHKWEGYKDGIGFEPAGMVVGVADGQLGKDDGDGVTGALKRSIEYLEEARADLDFWRQRYDVQHVEIPFLGDMLEGYVSQGGANSWRTSLTPGEQYRLVRRIMLHALKLFGDSAPQVSMVAIPGNHDQTIRFQGKGTTKYDDSWDVEALIALSDHAADIPALKNVKFYVPRTDEMTVVTQVAGTTMAYAHGHQFKPGKHFDWWKGQGFGGSPLADADVLMVGHLHHELMEADGRRTFLQAPSLESESTWFRHATGSTGNPGLMTAIVSGGQVKQVRVIR